MEIQAFAVIKKINIRKMSEEEKLATHKEAKILELLNHPGIIKFREIYKNSGGELCIVMDYADGRQPTHPARQNLTHINYLCIQVEICPNQCRSTRAQEKKWMRARF